MHSYIIILHFNYLSILKAIHAHSTWNEECLTYQVTMHLNIKILLPISNLVMQTNNMTQFNQI